MKFCLPGVFFILSLLASVHGQFLFHVPGTLPHGLTTDGTDFWLADNTDRKIFRLSQNGGIRSTFDFNQGSPRGLAYANGELFVATSSRIYRIDANSGIERARFAAPSSSSPQGIAWSDGRLWVASRGTNDEVIELNPNTGSVLNRFAAPGSNPRGMTFHDGSLWLLDSTTDLLYRISPANGAVLSTTPIPMGNPRGLTVFNGELIQVDRNLKMLMQIGPSPFTDVYLANQRYSIPGASLWLPYHSSHPVLEADFSIRRILFYQHGVSDNASEYFGRGLHAARLAGRSEETLVVVFQLMDDARLTSAPPQDMIYWTGGRFWGSLSANSSAPYPRSERLSAYTILDSFLMELTSDASRFPNLKEIVISGHSGGGQFANRYAASSPFEISLRNDSRDITVSYIVMNPSSYLYFDEKRFDPSTLDLVSGRIDFVTPNSPPARYNEYGYGLDDPYSYQAEVGVPAIRSQYPGRKVTYLIGSNDTDTANLDTDPEANLQGANRYERSLIYYAHLKDHFGEAHLPRHRMGIVPEVGHNGFDMITSPVGLKFHFQDPLKMSSISFSPSNATIRWSGGLGRADIQVSSDLSGWLPLATGVESPYIDSGVDQTHQPARFYRLRETPGP